MVLLYCFANHTYGVETVSLLLHLSQALRGQFAPYGHSLPELVGQCDKEYSANQTVLHVGIESPHLIGCAAVERIQIHFRLSAYGICRVVIVLSVDVVVKRHAQQVVVVRETLLVVNLGCHTDEVQLMRVLQS